MTCFLPPLPLQLHHNSCTTLASQGPTPLQLFSSKIVFPPFLHEIFYLCGLHLWHLCESPLFYRTNHTRFSSRPFGNCCLHPCLSTLSRGEGALPGRRDVPCFPAAVGAAFTPCAGLEVIVQRPSPLGQLHCRGAEGLPSPWLCSQLCCARWAGAAAKLKQWQCAPTPADSKRPLLLRDDRAMLRLPRVLRPRGTQAKPIYRHRSCCALQSGCSGPSCPMPVLWQAQHGISPCFCSGGLCGGCPGGRCCSPALLLCSCCGQGELGGDLLARPGWGSVPGRVRVCGRPGDMAWPRGDGSLFSLLTRHPGCTDFLLELQIVFHFLGVCSGSL